MKAIPPVNVPYAMLSSVLLQENNEEANGPVSSSETPSLAPFAFGAGAHQPPTDAARLGVLRMSTALQGIILLLLQMCAY